MVDVGYYNSLPIERADHLFHADIRYSAVYLSAILTYIYGMLQHFIDNIDIFMCPSCCGSLTVSKDIIACVSCGKEYPNDGGICQFYCSREPDSAKKDVTEEVKRFYTDTPFPNYEDIESAGDLIEKARQNIFARLLDEQTPYFIRVLEVGCGTGQLSNFLGISQRTVFGTDMCFNSLRLAEDFRIRHHLERVGFYQMNLFRPIFKAESFPLVICHGVLHHTSAPFEGFKTLAGLVCKGGYIIIGLYNKYGRISTDIRRLLFKIFGRKLHFLDPYLNRSDIGERLKSTWLKDQYMHPHESKHTFGEVLRWFGRTGFIFVKSIPKASPFQEFSPDENMFKGSSPGNAMDHFFVQMALAFTGYKDGGLFLVIGRKI